MRHNPLLYCIKELNSLLNGVYNTHAQNSEIGPPPKKFKKKKQETNKNQEFFELSCGYFFFKKNF